MSDLKPRDAIPAEWPPQPGDLWRSKFEPFFAVAAGDDDAPAMRLMNCAGELFKADVIRNLYGPLRLVHREEANEK